VNKIGRGYIILMFHPGDKIRSINVYLLIKDDDNSRVIFLYLCDSPTIL
jgi:hypothetical protein